MNILIIIIAVILLGGCGKPVDMSVTALHIEKANEVCAVNGGVALISRASIEDEWDGVGRAVRLTGHRIWKQKTVCTNGGTFHTEFRR